MQYTTRWPKKQLIGLAVLEKVVYINVEECFAMISPFKSLLRALLQYFLVIVQYHKVLVLGATILVLSEVSDSLQMTIEALMLCVDNLCILWTNLDTQVTVRCANTTLGDTRVLSKVFPAVRSPPVTTHMSPVRTTILQVVGETEGGLVVGDVVGPQGSPFSEINTRA